MASRSSPAQARSSRWPSRLLLVACLSLSCGRCGPAAKLPVASHAWAQGLPEPETTQPQPGGTLRLRLAADPAGLTRFHDGMADGVVARLMFATVYEALGRVSTKNPEGPLEPWLAASWEHFNEGAGLRIQLRPNVTFHDGSVFDAADLIATINAIRSAENPTVSWRQALGEMVVLRQVDASTVEVQWAGPAPFAERALLAGVPMLPKEGFDQPFETAAFHRQPIGTGPFRLESWKPNERLRFVAARGAHPPWLEAIEAVVIRDEAIAVESLRNGTLDVLPRASAATWRAVEQPEAGWARTALRRLVVPENTYAWVGFNQRRAPFNELQVRAALAAAYPDEAVARLVDLGLEPRTNCPFLFGSKSCEPTVSSLPSNPGLARALLADAGWVDTDHDGFVDRDGQTLAFTFSVAAGGAKMAKLAPLYQEALASAGVRMRIEAVEPAAYVQRLRSGDFDAAGLQWSSPDAVTDISAAFQSDGGSNYVGFHDAQADRLLEAIRQSKTDEERQGLERTLHRRLAEQHALLFLTSRPSYDLASRRVHGLVPSLSGYRWSEVWVSP